MKRISLGICSFLLILLLFSCSREAVDHYLITVGETIEIALEANWSTGYRWYFLNEDELSSVSNTDFDYGVEKAEEDPEEICGAPGFETWTFTGASRGTEILIFEY